MRRYTPFLLIAALSTASMTACSSAASAPAATVPVETAAAGTTPTPSATPTPPAAKGSTQTNADDDSEVKVTLLRVRDPWRPIVSDLPETPGTRYVGAEVKLCVTRDGGTEESRVGVSWSPWSVNMADDTVASALGAYSPGWWSEPLYPEDKVVRAGRCVRGWIPFEVRKAAKPVRVSYQPGSGPMLEWNLA